MNKKSKKPRLWTEVVIFIKEDQIFIKIVEIIGTDSWTNIAYLLKEFFGINRTYKQCRNRWVTKLSLKNINDKWAEQEIEDLLTNFELHGTRWTYISEIMKTKSENQIKNQFYTIINRNIRRFNKFKDDDQKIKYFDIEALSNTEIKNILFSKKTMKPKHFEKILLSEEAKVFLSSLELRKPFGQNVYTNELNINSIKGEEKSFLVNHNIDINYNLA